MISDWSVLTGTTWLDLGNGWRNLYLLSCLLQACALGTAFAIHHLFSKRSRMACFLTGVAVTPLVQYLWTLLLAVVWANAPKLVYIGALPALASFYGLFLLLRHGKRLPALLRQGWAFLLRICRFDKPALLSACFALALMILVLPACVRLCSSMNSANAGDSGEYMGLALRYCEDRDLGGLLEKEDTVGHFRGHSHFPSLELYMSYGLMHTSDAYGYPYDKPMLTSVGFLTFYMIAAYLALLLSLCRERKRWVLLGVLLLNLVPNLYYSVAGAPRDIWRILGVFMAALFFAELQPLRAKAARGGGKAYLGKLMMALIVCFTAMSTHVVTFVVLPFIVVAWVLSRWYSAALRAEKRTGRELFAAVGIALSSAVGTLIAFSGNLWCYLKWGEMSPWRLMTTFTTQPWYDAYMAGEYKLEITTTQLNFWQAKYDIVMAYATRIGLWGMRLALAGLLCTCVYLIWRRFTKARILTAEGTLARPGTKEGLCAASTLCFASLLTLFTLLPMTGLIDSKLYSFSGAFLSLQRYTLQWFMLAAVMIVAAFAALEGAWLSIYGWFGRKMGTLTAWRLRLRFQASRLGKALPTLLCAAFCLLFFVEGTQQTGYANSFYRFSRNVMEDENTLLDTGFLQRYGLLMTATKHVPEDRRILLTRSGYQYAIGARGFILTANPIVPLLSLTKEELPAALASENVAMLATEPAFWDERYYALSALGEYLNELPPEQILQDGSQMRLYILDPALAKLVSDEIAAAQPKLAEKAL